MSKLDQKLNPVIGHGNMRYSWGGPIADAIKEAVNIEGREHPDQQWIGTDYDTWELNPHYFGPDQRHPEDDPDEEGATVDTANKPNTDEIPF